MHAGKAAADVEKNAMFKRMKFLETENDSLSKRAATLLSENTELHNAERSRRAMPVAAGQQATTEHKTSRSPLEFYDIGGDAGEVNPGWAGHSYEDEAWCYAPAQPRTTKVEAQGITLPKQSPVQRLTQA